MTEAPRTATMPGNLTASDPRTESLIPSLKEYRSVNLKIAALSTVPLVWCWAYKVKNQQPRPEPPNTPATSVASSNPDGDAARHEEWLRIWGSKQWPVVLGLGQLWFKGRIPGPLWGFQHQPVGNEEGERGLPRPAVSPLKAALKVPKSLYIDRSQSGVVEVVEQLFHMHLFPLPINLNLESGVGNEESTRSLTLIVPHPYRVCKYEDSYSSSPSSGSRTSASASASAQASSASTSPAKSNSTNPNLPPIQGGNSPYKNTQDQARARFVRSLSVVRDPRFVVSVGKFEFREEWGRGEHSVQRQRDSGESQGARSSSDAREGRQQGEQQEQEQEQQENQPPNRQRPNPNVNEKPFPPSPTTTTIPCPWARSLSPIIHSIPLLSNTDFTLIQIHLRNTAHNTEAPSSVSSQEILEFVRDMAVEAGLLSVRGKEILEAAEEEIRGVLEGWGGRDGEEDERGDIGNGNGNGDGGGNGGDKREKKRRRVSEGDGAGTRAKNGNGNKRATKRRRT